MYCIGECILGVDGGGRKDEKVDNNASFPRVYNFNSPNYITVEKVGGHELMLYFQRNSKEFWIVGGGIRGKKFLVKTYVLDLEYSRIYGLAAVGGDVQ